MNIGIHGAKHTGKAALATALANALNERGKLGVQVALSPPLDSTGWNLTFLCGLDWVEAGSALDVSFRAERESEDAELRSTLTSARVVFQVLYGLSDVRVTSVFKAMDAANCHATMSLPRSEHIDVKTGNRPQWRWECEKCGDYLCERRLFSALVPR